MYEKKNEKKQKTVTVELILQIIFNRLVNDRTISKPYARAYLTRKTISRSTLFAIRVTDNYLKKIELFFGIKGLQNMNLYTFKETDPTGYKRPLLKRQQRIGY